MEIKTMSMIILCGKMNFSYLISLFYFLFFDLEEAFLIYFDF